MSRIHLLFTTAIGELEFLCYYILVYHLTLLYFRLSHQALNPGLGQAEPWSITTWSSPSLFCLVPGQLPGKDEERRFVTGEQEWTDFLLGISITIIITSTWLQVKVLHLKPYFNRIMYSQWNLFKLPKVIAHILQKNGPCQYFTYHICCFFINITGVLILQNCRPVRATYLQVESRLFMSSALFSALYDTFFS